MTIHWELMLFARILFVFVLLMPTKLPEKGRETALARAAERELQLPACAPALPWLADTCRTLRNYSNK